MNNDLLLNKLNALLDEKEAEAASQVLDQNFSSEEDIPDILTEKVIFQSETYDKNENHQRAKSKEALISEVKHLAQENDLSTFDKSPDELVATDDFSNTMETVGNSLRSSVALTLLSFILGGIFFQIILPEKNKEKMATFLTDSFSRSNSDGVSERISVLENYMRDVDLETNSAKVISAELSEAVSDLTDLNERLHGSFIDLQGRLDLLEEKNLIKNTENNIKIGSDQLYGENNSWFVNFGTYNDIRLARVWADRIENEGFSVAIETKSDSSPKQYRVRIIELASSKEAADVASKLTSRYKLPPLWIDEY